MRSIDEWHVDLPNAGKNYHRIVLKRLGYSVDADPKRPGLGLKHAYHATLYRCTYSYSSDYEIASTEFYGDKTSTIDELEAAAIEALLPCATLQHQATTDTVETLRQAIDLGLGEYLRESMRQVTEVQDVSVSKQASEILVQLKRELEHRDVGTLPALHTYALDDGSLIIEWIADDRRAAITVDPIESQSGWYVLTKDQPFSAQECGLMNTLDLGHLINHVQGLSPEG